MYVVAKAELITASFVPKCILKLEICNQIWQISKFSAPPPCPAILPWFLSCSVLLAGQALVHLRDNCNGCGYPASGVTPVGRAANHAIVLHFGSETGLDDIGHPGSLSFCPQLDLDANGSSERM